MDKQLTFLDLFAGIGGFRLGMERNGYKCLGHCEIDKYADASYRAMHLLTDEELEYIKGLSKNERINEIRKNKYLHGEWYAADITRVNARELPEVDVYCFGFPCQAFSIAGARRGFEDTRGTLFFEVMRLAAERKPKLLFAENVKGLLNHEGGATFGTIITAMEDLGYIVEWQLCNSKYFGVPQNREHVFIIGHLGTESFKPIFPIGNNLATADELQRHESVISNTLAAGKRDSNGIYPTDQGGYIQVNGFHKI